MLHRKKIMIKALLFTSLCILSLNCRDNNTVKGRITRQYVKDKKSIATMFMKNVEAVRLANLPERKKSISKNHDDYSWDPANLFSPYAFVYDEKKMSFLPSRIPTSSRLVVNTDTIFYNRDSLLAVALVIVQRDENISMDQPHSYMFDGRALLCCRNNVREDFFIYPFEIWSIIGYDNGEDVARDLLYLYTHKIKGLEIPARTVGEGNDYMGNVSEDSFFDTVIFQKNKDNKYMFQYYRYAGDTLLYNYFSNRSTKDQEIK